MCDVKDTVRPKRQPDRVGKRPNRSGMAPSNLTLMAGPFHADRVDLLLDRLERVEEARAIVQQALSMGQDAPCHGEHLAILKDEGDTLDHEARRLAQAIVHCAASRTAMALFDHRNRFGGTPGGEGVHPCR